MVLVIGRFEKLRVWEIGIARCTLQKPNRYATTANRNGLDTKEIRLNEASRRYYIGGMPPYLKES